MRECNALLTQQCFGILRNCWFSQEASPLPLVQSVYQLVFDWSNRIYLEFSRRGRTPYKSSNMPSPSSSEAWHSLDIRLGRIISAVPFPAARKPAYQLQLDFGTSIGTRQTSAQLVLALAR